MQQRAIAFMPFESIVRHEAIIEAHERIPHDLRDDRGTANDVIALVAPHQGQASQRAWRRHRAIHQHEIRGGRQIIQRQGHGVEGGLKDITLVDDVAADDPYPDLGIGLNGAKGVRALTRGQAFGVIDSNR